MERWAKAGRFRGRSRLVVPLGLWAFAIATIFGGYEVVERLWLGTQDMRLLHTLHMARGIGASAVTAVIIGFYIARRQPASTILGGVVSYLPKPEIELIRDRAAWFVRMRWFAAGLAGVGTLLTTQFTDLLPPENFVALMACVFALLAANAVFTWRVSRTPNPYRLIIIQAAADLLILTYLLHFSGGIENPFYLVYLPHVIIAGIILSKRDAFFITVLTCMLFLSLAGLEYMEVLHHSAIGFSPHAENPGDHSAHRLVFVVGEAIPFLLVTAFAAYFTILLRDQIQRDQANVLQSSKLATIGELSGRFAHEVNNPIGIVSTNAKLLLENTNLPREVRTILVTIDKHSERVAALTRGLLAFSRPSVDGRTAVDLNRVIVDSLRLVEPAASGSGVQMERNLADPPPLVKGNANELQQVILNLASNAVAAMPQGGILRIESQADLDGWVSLVIADTGTGIPPRIIDRIFDPFFTTKPSDQGTGLGLSIAQGLVRSHGGVIDVQSEEGQGTTFSLKFPCLTEKED